MMFQRDNHYVPCLYLKRFADVQQRVFTYRILVSDPREPPWKKKSIKSIAYHDYLYARFASGVDTDEMENWLNSDVETPAEEALFKATSGARLAPTDWHNLIRFLAAQQLRTPAKLSENLRYWNETVPATLEKTLHRSVHRLEAMKKSGQVIKAEKEPNSEYIPLRVKTERGEDSGTVTAEVVVGRGLWFFSLKRALTVTVNALYTQRWTVLLAPNDRTWFTSDDPVVALNYYSDGTYDFKGGWGRQGTEIFLPLSPRHLLYTKVGERPPARGSVVSVAMADMIRRLIAEHASRLIIAASVDDVVARFRPRTVSADLVRSEREQWRRWHETQTVAERELMSSR